MNLTNPISRTSDPDTSAEAAHAVTASGKRSRNAEIVLALVKQYPGCTAVELQRKPGHELDRHEVSRRLADLATRGYVYKGAQRACQVNGTQMVVWFATT